MKKSLLALAVMSMATTFAHADTTVQLYGILDEGFAHIEHSLPANDQFAFSLNPYNVTAQNQSSVNALVSGGASMSRWGIQGNEDLGGGMKTFFKLESAMNLGSGQIANNGQTVLNNANSLSTISGAAAINGQLFSRAAYVGLGDATWGSIELGRTTAFSFDQTSEFDPLHGSGLYSLIGFSGATGGGLGLTENSRLDNSLKYENKIGDVGFGLQYKIANTNSSEADDVGSVLEGMLSYKSGSFSLEATASQAKNTPALSFKLFTNDVGLRVSDTSGYMLTAKFEVTPQSTVRAGIERTSQSTPSSSNNWNTQITNYYGMSIAGLVTAKAFDPTWGSAVVTTAWIGEGYQFTDKFTLDAGYYNINNAANNHNDQYTIQALSMMADYSFTKHTDLYAGLMLAHYSGEYLVQQSPPTLATRNAIFGTGLRVRF
ncbi:porin [Solimicrobium silvestre]|uniref:Gram-negative porin n=1 Tax=Solimicrobium silvestre TaxID=2099400 RepID=A0A2S9H5I8_9BURK|nr:porin [Solimicrobium silvestre]PRC95136.1 Gram-negative porin [Solimicrobium silvestre]